MNTEEATTVVRQALAKYRNRPYAELIRFVDMPLPTIVLKGASGKEYQIEVQVLWDAKPGGDVRVVGSIDDGGWRAFVPLTEDFITAPNDIVSATW